MKKVKVGVVGVGGMGTIHAGAYMNNPEVEVVAACDINKKELNEFASGNWKKVEYEEALGRFEPKYQIKKTYTNYQNMTEDPEIDAVSICVPNVYHAPISLEMLKHNKHVFVEKPMAGSVKDCQKMIDMAEKKGVKLGVGHMWRFHSDVNFMRTVIEKGLLGKIIKTKGYSIHVNWAPSGWFIEKRLALGGALIDMGLHAIDTVKYLLGDPKPIKVWARISTSYGSYDVDDTGIVVIEFGNGTTSIIECGWNNPYADGQEASTQLFGTNGYGRVFPTEARYKVGTRWGVFKLEIKEPHQSLKMYQREIDHFVNCIINDEPPSISGRIGLEVVKIIEAAYQSSKVGNTIDLLDFE